MKNTLKVIAVLSFVCLVLWLSIKIVDNSDISKNEEQVAQAEENKTSLFEQEEVKLLDDYESLVITSGDIEAKYMKKGSYNVSYMENVVLQVFEKYEIWYPSEITSTDKKYPVIIFANATGVKASEYKPVFEHFASWGFIVIGTEDQFSWNAFAADMSLNLIKKLNDNRVVEGYPNNPFYNKVDLDNIGIRGHSQGGIGVINAITNTNNANMYKAAVSLSPPNTTLAKGLEWDFDASKVNIPILLISGTGDVDDKLIINLRELNALYNNIPNTTTKIMARRNDADHSETLYYNDGYVTAWFMWHLQDDMEAKNAFVGEDAEMKFNRLYQNQLFNIVR